MMKKFFITTIILFVSIGFTNAQFFTGVNTIFAYPLNNNFIDFGIGSKVEVGYSINKNIDFNIAAGNFWFFGPVSHKMRFVKVKGKYNLLNKKITPFIGFSSGYFQERFDSPFGGVITTDFAVGVQPSVGAKIELEFVKRVFVNTELSYLKVFSIEELNIINFNLGLLYYFQVKK